VSTLKHFDKARSLCALFSLIIGMVCPAMALNPDRQITQYGHTALRLDEGIFPSAPHAVAQTADGYIWIGTETGLVRFDGVRFIPWTAPAGQALPSTGIYSLAGTRDGGLWIGTGAGLASWKGGKLIAYPETTGRVNAIVEAADGTVWAVRSRARDTKGPLCRVNQAGARCYGSADGISFPWAQALVEDRQGGLWIGSTTGLSHWKAGASTYYLPKKLEHADGSMGVEALALGKDGTLLAGIGQSGAGLGVQTITAGAWKPFTMPGEDASAPRVAAILNDRDNGVWISTQDSGIYHVHAGRTDRYRQIDGLSSDTVTGLFEDREGNIWAVTPRGIDRFRDIAVGTVSRREGLIADSVASVLAERSGELRIANGKTLASLLSDKLSFTGIENGLPGKNVTSLLEDHAGRLWLGINTGLAVLQNGHFRTVRRADGTATGMLTGLAEDTDQNVWALAIQRPQQLLRIRDFQIAESIPLPDPAQGGGLTADRQKGIWVGHVSGAFTRYRMGDVKTWQAPAGSGILRNLVTSADGSVWAAATKGLIHLQDGRSERLDHRNGLPCDGIFALIFDASGSLWLYAECGLVEISSAELERWRANPGATLAVRTLDILDGAQPGATPFAPAATRSPDGRLWFTNDNVVQFIDPQKLPLNPVPPPIRIETIMADGVNYLPGKVLDLPALTKSLQIDYTALSFVTPQKVRFRYRLEGRDDQWVDASSRRQASYSDLPPATYRFRVIACNNSGVWTPEGAVQNFRIAPEYYQTSWFRASLAGAFLFGLWGIYRLRVWQIAARLNARFEDRIAERNRLSADLHDTFMQSVQASKMIADQALSEASPDVTEMRSSIARLSEWLARAMTDGQAVLNALHASTSLNNDLAASFRRAAELSDVANSMDFILSVEGTSRALHPIVRDDVYRIGSEAIQNSALHSGAGRMILQLTYGSDLIVRLSDDGNGLERSSIGPAVPGGSGLAEMQGLATGIGGHFRLFSRENSGTEIELRVPGRIAYVDFMRHDRLARLRSFLRTWKGADH
jgi:ligand-binding sensor domain-containing protein/signal transduction histidine kinase